jgi:hypothetical protein
MDLYITITPASPGGRIERADVVRTVAQVVADHYPGCQIRVEDRDRHHEVRVPCTAPGSYAAVHGLPDEALCPCGRDPVRPRDGETFCSRCRTEAKAKREVQAILRPT